MKLSVFVQTGLFSLAAGFTAPKGHEWRPQVPGQSRSPCPGLNVMANHGFLPRDGKNIDIDAVRSAVKAAYNWDSNVFDGAVNSALEFKLSTTGNSSTFNLADLAKHDAIEFDGSLSRNDIFFGDNLHFNPLIWGSVAARLDLHKIPRTEKDKYVTVEVAAKARAARVKEAMKINPHFNASSAEMTGSPGATGLYLATLWDDTANAAPKAWIASFFEQERIPYAEGYKLSKNPKTLEFLGAMAQAVSDVPV